MIEMESKLVSSALSLQVLPSHVTDVPLCNRESVLLMYKQKLSPYTVHNAAKPYTSCEHSFLCYTEIFTLLTKNTP